jgi:hypothetical protein
MTLSADHSTPSLNVVDQGSPGKETRVTVGRGLHSHGYDERQYLLDAAPSNSGQLRRTRQTLPELINGMGATS